MNTKYADKYYYEEFKKEFEQDLINSFSYKSEIHAINGED